MRGARLILIVGLPGSGKTTLARHIEQALPAVRLCADDWMDSLDIDIDAEQQRALIEQLQWKLAQQLLALGNIVIIEWGTWARAERDGLRIRARELEAAVELHSLDCPLEELFARAQQRTQEHPPIHLKQMQVWSSLFQPPNAEEKALFDSPLLDADSLTRRS